MVRSTAALLALGIVGGIAWGEPQQVAVEGSDVRFDEVIDRPIGGKSVRLGLTGTALREKFFLNVYAIASYVEKEAKIRSAEELAAADLPKALHLVMERDIDSKDMAAAIRDSINANYPEPQFEAERKILFDYVAANPIKKGDHVWLTHLPSVGISWKIGQKSEILIRSVKFSKAIWDIYFGENNLGVAIKRNLSSRL